MIYYLVGFIIVALLLILKAYLSENLFLSVFIFNAFYEKLPKLHSNDSSVNPVITSNKVQKTVITFCFQLGNHPMISNWLNNYHNACLRDDESNDIPECPYNTDNFLISNIQ